MPGVFNIFLSDNLTPGPAWGEGNAYAVGCFVRDFLNEVCRLSTCPFDSADYFYNSYPTLGSTDLYVYLLESQADSIIRRLLPGADLGSGGTTAHFPFGKLSEVYATLARQFANPERGLACLIFHESMHNKLGPDFDIHADGGGGLASKFFFSSSVPLTQKNKEVMAPALAKAVRQYVWPGF